MAWPNQMRTRDGVVHAPGYVYELQCQGRTVRSQREEANGALVTCLWCLVGVIAADLQWFDEGDAHVP
jgi:hypothetical protein